MTEAVGARREAEAQLELVRTDLSGAVEQVIALSDELNRTHQRLNEATWLAQGAEAKLVDYRTKAELGHLIEVEYPVRPRVREWPGDSGGLRSALDRRREHYGSVLDNMVAQARGLADVADVGDPSHLEPYWNNGWFPNLDGLHLYCQLATRNPRLYIEVGSGNSTKFARRAVRDHGLRTTLISIDPHPRAEVDTLCDQIVRKPCEDVDPSFFDQLGPTDVFFVDNSHRGFQSSDVTVFFTEILPRLKPGVLWGIHDIFLPFDYPAGWLNRYFNEQYFLMCYLLGGGGADQIDFPAFYVSSDQEFMRPFEAKLAAVLGERPPSWWAGGAFWMSRR